MQKICLTGIKPTGTLHLGNYFGAMKPLLELSQQGTFDEVLIFVANLHALNSIPQASLLREYSYDIVESYLAIGLDPKVVTIFIQSEIRELTELTWIFNNLVTVSYLERSHAYKEAVDNGKEANMGLFDYPVLMAADILIYDSSLVPVGQDQKQHIEIAQKIADKFNTRYGANIFSRPKPLIQLETQVQGLDGRKMSKSYHNTIDLFESDKTTRQKVMKIVTDSKAPHEPKDPDSCHILALYRLFASPEDILELEGQYRAGSISYREAKELLADSMIRFLAPIRQRKKDLAQQPEYIHQILAQGAGKARALAQAKMNQVREIVGLTI